MKHLSTILFSFFYFISFAQTKDTLTKHTNKTPNIVTFITKFDIAKATKDGFYLNGYVVNIGYEQAKKLSSKKIRVTGKVTIVKGLTNRPKEYDKNGDEIVRQGRINDTKYIDAPLIEIIDN